MNYANFGLDLFKSITDAAYEGKRIDLASRNLALKNRALDTERDYNYARLAFEKQKFETNADLRVHGDLYRMQALRAAGYRFNPYSNGNQIYADEAAAANLHSFYSFYKTD
ncbi:putative minor structural protein [Rabbit vesivirus]|uniref:putative minor structural protein n=1 Tax=Rabbit vesivirus TaxID=303317 RepID=UPI000051D669|nr:putative minor structural protein [Rabbit vesivirus]QID91557.1 minor capsid component VP2 [Cloning vector RaV_infectious_clone_(pT7-RaV)]CAI29270.1 putative minor structural protein [Rabbit vesivirus]